MYETVLELPGAVFVGFGYYLTESRPDSWVALLFAVLVALGIWRLMYLLHSDETANRVQPAD